MIGPTTGTQAYAQSESPFPATGRTQCASRGPRSRAGLIAYPVGPPSDSPIENTSSPTRNGPNPASQPLSGLRFLGLRIASTPSTRKNVPIASVIRFAAGLRIAGIVQNPPRLDSLLSVAAQCGRY